MTEKAVAKYVPVKDLDELLSARAAGVLWYDDAPELAKESELRHWWKIAVKNESDGWMGKDVYILPKDWSILVEDDEEGDSSTASGASAEDE